MEGNTLRFAHTAKALGRAAHRLGLGAPSFRSPPKDHAVARAVRRNGDGTTTVSVALRDRPWAAVVADMIEGVVVANHLDGAAAAPVRDALWTAVAALVVDQPETPRPRPARPAGPRARAAPPADHAAAA
ncbi:MAG: hypothetical protein KDB33_00090 [Acidimicrobiales bacterium]|nr:hypothetical protein [Acidimicrobiales bacterium]MCB1258794.1 hypothetical protein [Acidimicrobiales bacterium]